MDDKKEEKEMVDRILLSAKIENILGGMDGADLNLLDLRAEYLSNIWAIKNTVQ